MTIFLERDAKDMSNFQIFFLCRERQELCHAILEGENQAYVQATEVKSSQEIESEGEKHSAPPDQTQLTDRAEEKPEDSKNLTARSRGGRQAYESLAFQHIHQ